MSCADLEVAYVIAQIAGARVYLQGKSEGTHVADIISCCAGQIIDGGPRDAAVCEERQRLGESLS